ncbi:NAD(P)-dependent oxidoreductase [Candidatus Woesearchaeota archaeon]|nr:NAD(P)-dependent oxidoreductase [Candidatus Woesearchaeota archaeon]
MLQQNENIILLTGGSGFIGKHVLAELMNTGHRNVYALTRNCHKANKSEGFQRAEGDITKPETLKGLAGLNITTAIHLAALMPNAENKNNITEHMLHNLEGTINLFNALPNTIRQFIFISTVDVYGKPARLPVKEDHPPNPESYYAISKLASEQYLKIACRERGTILTILRLSHVYGPGEPAIKAIPTFITSFLKGNAPVLYSSPNEARDYVYVDDTASAIRLAAETGKGGTYNIATGKPQKIWAVLEQIRKILKSQIEPRIEKSGSRSKKQKPLTLCFDITAAGKGLGYRPKTPFKEGLTRETEWFKNEKHSLH